MQRRGSLRGRGSDMAVIDLASSIDLLRCGAFLPLPLQPVVVTEVRLRSTDCHEGPFAAIRCECKIAENQPHTFSMRPPCQTQTRLRPRPLRVGGDIRRGKRLAGFVDLNAAGERATSGR